MSDQEVQQPGSGIYTCLACQVAFKSGEGQRTHYRSEWHRYNLKRKVDSLPPVTSEQFNSKAQGKKKKGDPKGHSPLFLKHIYIAREDKEEEEKKVVETTNKYCNTCRKSFGSVKQYENHVQSKKHKENEQKKSNSSSPEIKPVAASKAKAHDMTFTEETTEEEMNRMIDEKIKSAPRLTELDCLFCTHASETFEDNMQHMTSTHSLFIPDIEYLVDLRGLVRYLGEKISVGNECIFCNGKGRGMRSIDAVRKHMVRIETRWSEIAFILNPFFVQ
jgi:pre-60S factor REI1